jgi:DNA-nicking Smr family endonuclease
MKLTIGDKVRFLNEKGEGIVSKLLNKTTVAVTIEDGFEIPYLITELVLITEHTIEMLPENTKEKEIAELPKTIQQNKSAAQEKEGIYIGLSPEKLNDIAHSDFNVWLINATDYNTFYTYSTFNNGHFKTLATGSAKANENLLIETINRKELHDYSNFKIDVLFYNTENHFYQKPVSEIIKLKPIKLYKENAFVKNNFISENALIMHVAYFNEDDAPMWDSSEDLSKILFMKQHKEKSQKTSKPHIINNLLKEVEIDLHIEELLDNYHGMSNFEIVQVQLTAFQKALDKAINEHCRKLTVIHGVGNGRLKQEVRRLIATQYPKLNYYDGSYAKYGFGATEVDLI